jgi:hypothetical protein
MPNKIIDIRILRMKDGQVVKDYGVHDGARDGKDVALKYYAPFLKPGETFHTLLVERTQVLMSDLTESQRMEVQRDRHLQSVDAINGALAG